MIIKNIQFNVVLPDSDALHMTGDEIQALQNELKQFENEMRDALNRYLEIHFDYRPELALSIE